MIKAVLWDIDGTLLDFKAAEKAAIQTCFEIFSLGKCTDEMISEYSQINDGYWKRLERNEITKPQVLVGRFEEFFSLHGIATEVAKAFNDEYQVRLGDTVCFAPHAKETLQELKEKDRIYQCAVTNGTRIAQHRKLKNSGLDQIFDAVFISDEIGIEKPNKGFFDYASAKMEIFTEAEMLIVGDSLTSDIRGGNNAGIRTCWFNPHHKENDQKVHVDFEIEDIAQVLDIVRTE